MNEFLIVSIIVTGVLALGFVITMIVTSVLIDSSLSDSWLKPGEQRIICKNKEFTVLPESTGISAYIFPEGLPSPSGIRTTSEIINGTFESTSLKDITLFHSYENDSIYVEFESFDGVAEVEVYYIKKVVKAGRSNGHSVTRTVKKNFPVLSLSGSDYLYGSDLIPCDHEFHVAVKGTKGATYMLNITHKRSYYEPENETLYLNASEKVYFNSEKVKKYCIVLDNEYDGPITDPDDSVNLDLYCAKRYSQADIIAIVVFATLTGIGIFMSILNFFIYMD